MLPCASFSAGKGPPHKPCIQEVELEVAVAPGVHYRIEELRKVGFDFWKRKIEYPYLAAPVWIPAGLHRSAARVAQNPIGMIFGNLRAGHKEKRSDPDAGNETLLSDLPRYPRHAVGKFFGMRLPVTHSPFPAIVYLKYCRASACNEICIHDIAVCRNRFEVLADNARIDGGVVVVPRGIAADETLKGC